MPGAREHHDQAWHNLAFARSTSGTDPDWRATALFYAAVHHVDAALDRHLDSHPTDHKQRRDGMAELKERGVLTRDAYTAYRTLETRSRDARYNCTWRGNASFAPAALSALEQSELTRVVSGLL